MMQPVEQPSATCKQTLNWLHRVNGV